MCNVDLQNDPLAHKVQKSFLFCVFPKDKINYFNVLCFVEIKLLFINMTDLFVKGTQNSVRY